MHSARHPIEFGEAGGDSSDPAFAFVKFFDGLDGLHHLVFHRKHLAFEAILPDGENFLLYFVEEIADFVLLFVSATHAFGRGGDDRAQNVFVPNDLEVVTDVGGGRHKCEQARDRCGATHRFQQISIAQNLCERDQVDSRACVPEIDQDAVDGLMRRNVEIFLVNFLDDFRDRVARRDQH